MALCHVVADAIWWRFRSPGDERGSRLHIWESRNAFPARPTDLLAGVFRRGTIRSNMANMIRTAVVGPALVCNAVVELQGFGTEVCLEQPQLTGPIAL